MCQAVPFRFPALTPKTMRSLLCTTGAAALLIGTVALAVLTPSTEQNKRPMAALILLSTFVASPALLIMGARD